MFDFCFMLKYFLFSKVGKNNKKNVNENENYKKKGSKKTSHTRYQKTHFYFKVGLNRRFAVKKVR